MTTRSPRTRRAAHLAAWLGTVIAAVGLAAQVVAALPAGTPPESVPEVVPSSGDSGTAFKFVFPSFIACPGDATEDYRWTTFITPIAQDPATLTFDGQNFPVGAAPTAPLLNTAQQAVAAQLPSIGTGAIGIVDVDFDFAAAPYNGFLPTGEYRIGIACTQPVDLVVENVRFWSTSITITEQAGAGPNNFVWEVSDAPAPTTEVPTTDGSAPGTDDSTTTTDPAATTTTDPSATTTTDVTSSATTTTTTFVTSGFGVSSSGVGGSPTTSGQPLPNTGSSSVAIAAWAVVLVIFGRMAILLGREPKVIPADER